MAILGKEKKSNEVEDRLRARLADIEGRLDDSSKIRQLEDHIRFLNQKHQLEIEKASLAAREKVQEVQGKAAELVKEAKRRISGEQARYQKLVEDLAKLEANLKMVQTRSRELSAKGLKLHLAPNGGIDRSVAAEPREFVSQLATFHRDLADQLMRVSEAIGDGKLEHPTTDVTILEERTKELLTNPELKSKALTVSEKARMFGVDPAKAQYYRELIVPYTRAIQKVLEADTKASVVLGCQEALAILETAFRDSRTFLLRRSGDLDNHDIPAEVSLERMVEAPEDALGRMNAVMDNARALGPVDFFHNILMEVNRSVERGDAGARVAAWVLSDVTVAVLEDARIQKWLAGQR
jgi:hypothetical protein